MYDYMRALEDTFTPDTENAERRQELEAKRQAVSDLLDKQGKKKLLRLVDAHTAMQEEMALSSFIAGFRLAWGIATELGANGKYSYEQEQEQINRLKNRGTVNKREGVKTHGKKASQWRRQYSQT